MNNFSKFTFISYFEAKQYLEDQFDSTPDEIAQWVSIGAEKGGLNAYTSECENQSRFSFEPSIFINDDDYIKPLEKLYFLSMDIVQFQPDRRYITRLALKERWIKFYDIWEVHDYEDEDEAMNYLETKINESHLLEYHPIAGVIETRGQLFRGGLFDKKEVEEKELEQTQKSKGVIRKTIVLKGRTKKDSKIKIRQIGTKKVGELKLLSTSSVQLSKKALNKKCIFLDRNSNAIITAEKTSALQLEQQSETLSNNVIKNHDGAKSKQSFRNKIRVVNKFSEFDDLQAKEISLIVMENNTIRMVIRKKTITVFPDDFGLTEDSQGWKLLTGAAVSSGDLSLSLKELNSSRDLESEKTKIKTAVSRLRNKLKVSMGLKSDPIIFLKGSGYKFNFKLMGHELIHGTSVSKGGDAMDHIDDRFFDDNQHRENNFVSSYKNDIY